MRKHRFYHTEDISIGKTIDLDKDNSYQITKVLRLKPEQEIWLFNNTNFEFKAIIQDINKNSVTATILKQHPNNKESNCNIHLAQAIAKGSNMDYIIQKSVELGVKEITPLITERTIVHIPKERLHQRMEHWQKIITHACCQCGRSIIPIIHPPIELKEWIIKHKATLKIILEPKSTLSFSHIPKMENINLMIGPEGGFSSDELLFAKKHNIMSISLGPRILRTETAGIVAIAGIQMQCGDLQ